MVNLQCSKCKSLKPNPEWIMIRSNVYCSMECYNKHKKGYSTSTFSVKNGKM